MQRIVRWRQMIHCGVPEVKSLKEKKKMPIFSRVSLTSEGTVPHKESILKSFTFLSFQDQTLDMSAPKVLAFSLIDLCWSYFSDLMMFSFFCIEVFLSNSCQIPAQYLISTPGQMVNAILLVYKGAIIKTGVVKVLSYCGNLIRNTTENGIIGRGVNMCRLCLSLWRGKTKLPGLAAGQSVCTYVFLGVHACA